VKLTQPVGDFVFPFTKTFSESGTEELITEFRIDLRERV
jgi:hypothetical protein